MVYVIHTLPAKGYVSYFLSKNYTRKVKKAPNHTYPKKAAHDKLVPTEIISIDEFDCYLCQIQNTLF